jgi:NTE family protein
MKITKKIKLSLLLVLLSFGISSQNKQPKIGLVLSGGGVKGFAHIGVLKEIDKAGLQIDYIGGTSMGAIVGGLYAYGYSGLQIEEIILKTDFLALLKDDLPRSSEPFFEKEYGEKAIVTLPVNKWKVGFPKGVSKGQNVINLLTELFYSADKNQDFSKLSIPFFCVATDVENGAPVVLEKGSLPIALRASSSIPSILNPVEIGDKLVIDGGIANNFPVSTLREKGMDVIIGVDVQGKLFQKDKINSLVALMNQIISYKMYNKTDQEKKKLDVYIHPEILKYGMVDFDKTKEILEIGDAKAKEYSAVFKELAKKQLVKKTRKKRAFNTDKFLISDIKIEGTQNYTRAYFLGKLNARVGDSLSRNDITKKIYLLSATRNYDRIEYELIKKKNGSYLLDFKIKESNEDANLKIGVHYDLLYKSSVLATYNHKHLFKKNDLFSLDLLLGDNLRYNLNYFVDNGFYISYGFRSRYNHFRSNSKYAQDLSAPDVANINLSYTDVTNQLFFQTTFNRKFALGVGIEHKWIKASTETLATKFNSESILDKSNYFNAFGYLKLDTYNKKYFATKGYFADLNFKWFAASTDYNNDFKAFYQAKGTLGFAATIADRFTFQNTNEAGFTINKPTSNVFDFYLGGYNQNYVNNFVSLYGYEFSDLSNNSFVKSEFNLRYRIGDVHYASFIANYARLEEDVFTHLDLFKDIKSGYAVGYSYDSLIGPIEIKYSWSPDNNENHWLFNLGFWF